MLYASKMNSFASVSVLINYTSNCESFPFSLFSFLQNHKYTNSMLYINPLRQFVSRLFLVWALREIASKSIQSALC